MEHNIVIGTMFKLISHGIAHDRYIGFPADDILYINYLLGELRR